MYPVAHPSWWGSAHAQFFYRYASIHDKDYARTPVLTGVLLRMRSLAIRCVVNQYKQIFTDPHVFTGVSCGGPDHAQRSDVWHTSQPPTCLQVCHGVVFSKQSHSQQNNDLLSVAHWQLCHASVLWLSAHSQLMRVSASELWTVMLAAFNLLQWGALST